MTTADDPGERAAALHEQAIVLREAGSFADAEAVCRQAVTLFEQSEGDESPNLANALVEHARVLELLDRLDEAGRAGDRALAILRPLVAAPSDDQSAQDSAIAADQPAAPVSGECLEEFVRLTVLAEGTRASTFRACGDLTRAEAGCRRALALAEAHLPADDALIGSTLNDLGVVHKFQGRYAEAEPLYRRALDIAERDHRREDIATLLHNLGGLAHARGDHATGEPLARRSVELREDLLGADHPATAADRAAWGALLEGLGRAAEAERAYVEALAVFETRLGPHSAETASALAALATVQHARGALDDAERHFRRSVTIREAILPPGHFDIALTLNNLAMLLVDRAAEGAPHARAEAEALLKRAHIAFVAALGPRHAHTRAVAKNLRTLANQRPATA